MSDRKQQLLAAKVKAANRCHAEINRLFPLLVEAARPFLGCKIIKKTDGYFTAKFKNALPDLPYGDGIKVLRSKWTTALGWEVTTDEMVDDISCTYWTESFHIGDLSDGVLTALDRTFKPWRTDYTELEIASKRRALEEAKKAVDEARNALYPFGENDNH